MSLTTTAQRFRFGLKFGWLVIFIPIAGMIILRLASGIGGPTAPPPEQPTFTAAFGKLPALEIVSIDIQPGESSVSLDLINAALPGSTDIIAVYPVLSAPYGFLSRDRALQLGKNLGFADEPQVVDETQLVWRQGLEFLTINATTLNFRYTYDYRSNPTVFRQGRFAREEFAIDTANEIMDKLGILGGSRGPDLSSGEVTSQKLRYDGTNLITSATLAQSSAVLVNYFRTPVEELNIVSPQFYDSIVNILIPSVSDPEMLELNYTYWELDRKNSATYPLEPAANALGKFQSSPETYIVFLGDAANAEIDTTVTSVTEYIIKDVQLAYYDTAAYQQYLQPVWVLVGEAIPSTRNRIDFVAYIPAVSSDWIE